MKYGLEVRGSEGICELVGIKRWGWGRTKSLLLVCIESGDDDEIGGELVGVPETDDGINRRGGGSKWGAPGRADGGRKLPGKVPGIPMLGIPLDKPGINGELDSDDDDFLASSWRLPKFKGAFIAGIILLVTCSLSFTFGIPKIVQLIIDLS